MDNVEIPEKYAGREVITLATRIPETAGAGITPNVVSIYARIRDFNDAQDEIYVALKSYMDPHGLNLSYERMYAQIATGDWSDLYYTGWLDFDSDTLNNAGLIQDWYPVLEADPEFQMDEYMTNIWGLLENCDGALYDLCFSLTVNGGGGAGCIASREEFGSRADWTYDEYTAYLKEKNYCDIQDSLLKWGYAKAYMDWVDLDTMTCNFEDASFLEWLSFLSSFPKEEHAGATQPTSYGLRGITNHVSIYELTGYWSRYRGLPGRYPHGPSPVIEDSLALSSTTEHLDACMTFIKWLLSYESQWKYHADANNGFPLRRDVFEEALERAQLPGDDEESLFAGKREKKVVYDGSTFRIEFGDYFPGLPAEEADYLRNLLEGFTGSTRGVAGSDIFKEEVRMFLAGDITDEECAERLQSRFTILLAERK